MPGTCSAVCKLQGPLDGRGSAKRVPAVPCTEARSQSLPCAGAVMMLLLLLREAKAQVQLLSRPSYV